MSYPYTPPSSMNNVYQGYSPYYSFPNFQQQNQQNLQQPTQLNNTVGNYQQMPQPISQSAMQQNLINGGLVIVQNEQMARDYPVAPGNFVTFKDENSKYMYEKSRTLSQLDPPVFKKFRLIEEEDTKNKTEYEEKSNHISNNEYALLADVKGLAEELQSVKTELEEMKKRFANIQTNKEKLVPPWSKLEEYDGE